MTGNYRGRFGQGLGACFEANYDLSKKHYVLLVEDSAWDIAPTDNFYCL